MSVFSICGLQPELPSGFRGRTVWTGFVLEFSRGDGQAQPILRRSERAGCEGNIRAGQVGCLVEIQDNHVALGRGRKQLPGSAVSRPATGPVAEDEPERTVGLARCLELVRFSSPLEDGVA